VLTAIRLKTTVEKIGRQGLANGEAHLRPINTLQKLYPPELLARTIEIAERCTFSLKTLRYEYAEELCQGRESAANSAVCYVLGITEVDPARMDLLLDRLRAPATRRSHAVHLQHVWSPSGGWLRRSLPTADAWRFGTSPEVWDFRSISPMPCRNPSSGLTRKPKFPSKQERLFSQMYSPNFVASNLFRHEPPLGTAGKSSMNFYGTRKLVSRETT
jgi:hypothetical protein